MSALYVPLDMLRQTRQGGTGQPTLATEAKGKALLDLVVSKGIAALQALRAKKL